MNTVSIARLLDVGVSLSREKDSAKLFEIILTAAMDITNCDGGTLYTKSGDFLEFKLMFTRSNGTMKGGRHGEITLPPVPLSPKNVCSRASLDGKLINIPDVYESEKYDFSGPRKYDKMTGYKTTSMMVVPMEDERGLPIGVLQLINAQDEDGIICPFDQSCEAVILSLASQAAICLMNVNYAQEIQELLDSLVLMMSTAIDARTPYNANHTRNMVKYGTRFVDWLAKTKNQWQFSAVEKRQFQMSVWLHDAGKIAIPLEVMDKESRLGADIERIVNRFETIGLLDKISLLSNNIDEAEFGSRETARTNALELIKKANNAGFLQDEILDGINQIAAMKYIDQNGEEQPYITPPELVELSVRKGTLTNEERKIMESHVTLTSKMLADIKFPNSYSMVAQWAGEHHEFLNGSGYPKGLHECDIRPEVRLLTILDIFDALTAMDRPYKAGMPVSKALSILQSMVEEGKLDGKILALFIESECWIADKS